MLASVGEESEAPPLQSQAFLVHHLPCSLTDVQGGPLPDGIEGLVGILLPSACLLWQFGLTRGSALMRGLEER